MEESTGPLTGHAGLLMGSVALGVTCHVMT